MMMLRGPLVVCALLSIGVCSALPAAEPSPPPPQQWEASPPLVPRRDIAGISTYSIKDPTVVQHEGRWHLFCTIRGKERSHAIVTLSFDDWNQASTAEWHLLTNHDGFFCAPQVFYFEPQQCWYLVCQAANPEWGEPPYRPAYATTTDIDDPASWSKLQPMSPGKPEGPKAWLDFWVICDDAKAHLFFTSLDGKMWRAETPLGQFPLGWSAPQVALEGDVFEASHTYRVQGRNQYLTMIEAQGGQGWRYFKLYAAERLEGPWTPIRATREQAFASMGNVRQPEGRWTDSISHGEILRASSNQRLEIEPEPLRIVFQGVTDDARRGKSYGEIPWQLGLLSQVPATDDP